MPPLVEEGCGSDEDAPQGFVPVNATSTLMDQLVALRDEDEDVEQPLQDEDEEVEEIIREFPPGIEGETVPGADTDVLDSGTSLTTSSPVTPDVTPDITLTQVPTVPIAPAPNPSPVPVPDQTRIPSAPAISTIPQAPAPAPAPVRSHQARPSQFVQDASHTGGWLMKDKSRRPVKMLNGYPEFVTEDMEIGQEHWNPTQWEAYRKGRKFVQKETGKPYKNSHVPRWAKPNYLNAIRTIQQRASDQRLKTAKAGPSLEESLSTGFANLLKGQAASAYTRKSDDQPALDLSNLISTVSTYLETTAKVKREKILSTAVKDNWEKKFNAKGRKSWPVLARQMAKATNKPVPSSFQLVRKDEGRKRKRDKSDEDSDEDNTPTNHKTIDKTKRGRGPKEDDDDDGAGGSGGGDMSFGRMGIPTIKT